jgi:hypothetical protein
MPGGSVRAVLALMIFGTIWGLLLRRPDREIPDYLRDLLFIILGHYFAVRGRADRTAEAGPPPLFLPTGTVRLVLIAGSRWWRSSCIGGASSCPSGATRGPSP